MARSKAGLKAALLAELESQLAAARLAHETASSGATDDEARPENSKDTRGLELSYLARGHAARVAELETAVAVITVFAPRAFGDGAAIALGALVTLEDADRTRVLWLAPHGGGIVLDGDVTVVTPTSALGQALLGKQVDDELSLGKRTSTIVAVA
jgi:hypothetical protein